MKTLFLRLNYCALAALLCSSSVCLGADAVASVITPAQNSTVVQPVVSTVVPAVSTASATVSAAPAASTSSATVSAVQVSSTSSVPMAVQTAPSATELQAVDAQRVQRHKKSEELAAKLIEQLSSSLNAVKAAKDKADADKASAQAVVAAAPIVVAPAPAAVPAAPAVIQPPAVVSAAVVAPVTQ